MPVVRKLDGELPLVFGFCRLIRRVWFAKTEARSLAWCGPDVADGADRGACSDDRLAAEKLWAMTTHAGVVIRKVGNVGKISLRIPGCGNFVADAAGEAFVFRG